MKCQIAVHYLMPVVAVKCDLARPDVTSLLLDAYDFCHQWISGVSWPSAALHLLQVLGVEAALLAAAALL